MKKYEIYLPLKYNDGTLRRSNKFVKSRSLFLARLLSVPNLLPIREVGSMAV